MGKGKGGGPPEEDIPPDSPTPEFADGTDVADAADYSIDVSQSTTDGDQATVPILVPVDNAVLPNPTGEQPVDPNTNQPPADPSSGANAGWGSAPSPSAGAGQSTGGSPIAPDYPYFPTGAQGASADPANPFSQPPSFIAQNWQNLLAQNWDPSSAPSPSYGFTYDGSSFRFVPAPTPSTIEGGWTLPPPSLTPPAGDARPDSSVQPGAGAAQQAAPPVPADPPSPPAPPGSPPPPPPFNLDQAPWGGGGGGGLAGLPPVSATLPGPLPSTRLLGSWPTLSLSTLPPGAPFTPARLPPTPGTTFSGGRAQSPTPRPTIPAAPPDWTTQTEWTFALPDPNVFQFPPITSLDTGSQTLNFVLNKVLLPWVNLLNNVVDIPLAAIQEINNDLRRADPVTYQAAQDMLPLQAAWGLSMEVGPALEYATTWLSTNFRTLAIGPYSPTWLIMGTGGSLPAGRATLQDVSDLLQDLRAAGIQVISVKDARDWTQTEIQAAIAYRDVYQATSSNLAAGNAFHNVLGAAADGTTGPDRIMFNFVNEVKTSAGHPELETFVNALEQAGRHVVIGGYDGAVVTVYDVLNGVKYFVQR
jgi:hypothetical protein